MRRLAGLAVGTAIAACGGSAGPQAAPAPEPGAPPITVPTAPAAPVRYRLRGPLQYDVARYDTLTYETMPGAPQISDKRAVLTVRPTSARNTPEVEILLDSVAALNESRLAAPVIDSSLGTRWQVILTPTGPRGLLLGGRPTILSGQIEEIARLLFPQLPLNGVRAADTWSDSTGYRLRLDAFDSFESAARTSRAAPAMNVAAATEGAVTVEAVDRLSRTGTAAQGGQTMTLRGSGLRRTTYDFTPDGWVGSLVARDSLDLIVTISPDGQTVPVRWRSTLTVQVRGPSPH